MAPFSAAEIAPGDRLDKGQRALLNARTPAFQSCSAIAGNAPAARGDRIFQTRPTFYAIYVDFKLIKIMFFIFCLLSWLRGTAMTHSKDADYRLADVWYTVCPVPSALSISIARNTLSNAFGGSGVTFTSVRTHRDRDVREAHYDQRKENLFREGGNIPPLWAKSVGVNLRLLGLTWIEHFSSLVTLKSANIRHPSDLRGKRIGLFQRPNDRIDYARATALRGSLIALKAGGIDRSAVTFVDIVLTEPLVAAPPPPGVLSGSAFSSAGMRKRDGIVLKALLEGHVDAVYLTSREADLSELLDARILYDASQALNPVDRISNATPIAFTVRGELVEQRPDIAVGVLAEAIRTARWAGKNAIEANRFIARDSGITEDSVATRYSPGVASRLEPSLGADLLRYLDVQKNFLLEEGFIPNDFSITEFAAPEILTEALSVVEREQSAVGKTAHSVLVEKAPAKAA